jgi:uncharacterized protein (DUF2252 family)
LNEGRLPELVPIRYGRMLRSPFTFLRGSAPLMADDLATTPTTGIRVQAFGVTCILHHLHKRISPWSGADPRTGFSNGWA